MNQSFTRAFGVLISLLFFIGCGHKDRGGFQRPPATVAIDTAVARDVPVYIDAVGKTVAIEVVSIQPQVSGHITEIHFQDGAQIKKGQLLFTIDPRPYQTQLHSAEAMLAQRKAELQLAQVDLTRSETLVKKDFISKQDYDNKKSAVDVAAAQVQQSQSALEAARLNLDYCSIRSPINGRAGHRLVDLGNVVKPEDGKPLLVIQRLDPIYADFTIAENDLTAVQQNLSNGALKTLVRLPDDQDAREGSLSFIDNAVQDGTGTVRLRATISNQDEHFWPGRLLNVRLVLSTIHSAVLVPASSPQMSATGPFVYVIKQDSTAELRPVTLGQRQDDMIVITKGVSEGEKVVTKGQLGVTPGGKVQEEKTGNMAQGMNAGAKQ
jgi:multidrug efflux system membrane fusion protein